MATVISLKDSEKPNPLVVLRELVDDEMADVDRIIKDKIISDVKTVPEVGAHIVKAGGKRLRPILTIAAAKLCGYHGPHHVTLAAAVEFMHTATLLHDDVVDESDLRRGRPTARMGWGNAASVLVGDFLLGQAFKLMVSTDSMPALDVLSNAAAVIAEGEVLQLATMNDLDTTEDAYMRVVDAKTAALFAAASEVGGLIEDNDPSVRAALSSYGRNLGIAFQLVDDALDYDGSADMGKNAGDDFREGKITLPVVLCFRRGDDTEREFWRRVIEEGRQNDEDFVHALELIRKHDTLTDTIERAAHYGAIAKDALAIFPDNKIRQAMIDVVDFCISRAY